MTNHLPDGRPFWAGRRVMVTVAMASWANTWCANCTIAARRKSLFPAARTTI